MEQIKKFFVYIVIIFIAFVAAANYNVFVFPNSFAPAGIDGICTMVQDLSGIDIGYLSLVVNIPLVIAAWILLDRDYAVKTTIYVIMFSVADIFLKYIGIESFAYHTDNSIVLAPISAGVIRGLLYIVMIKTHSSGGGVDIIASLVKRKRPYLNLMNTIFAINLSVAVLSYFVYGFKLEPVICGIIYFYTTSTVSNSIRTSRSETIKIEAITENAEDMCHRISSGLNLTATIVYAKGGYSGQNKKMVICIAEKSKVPGLEKLIEEYPDAVLFKSVVNNSLAEI